jgi:Zn finger protein HypA/HybF involved in hydrogenase expression
LSLALEVGRIVEGRLQVTGGRLLEIGVQVGDDAGVEPDNLAFCLDAVLAHPPFNGAKAVLLRSPGDALRVEYLEIDDDDSHD